MKHITRFLALFTLLLYEAVLNAQPIPGAGPNTNKPSLFTDMPDTLQISSADLMQLITIPEGQSVSILIGTKLQYNGMVMYNNINDQMEYSTVIIRSSNRSNSCFTLSKLADKDGNIFFRGQIISFKHADAFVLQPAGPGNYYFIKKRTDELLCE